MGKGAFAAEITFLDKFRAVPGPAAEVIAIATNKPVTIVPTSRPPRTTGPSGLMTATATTNATGRSAGTTISRSGLRHDIDAGAAIRFVLATQNVWLRGQLSTHFTDDTGGLADRVHAERCENERQQAATVRYR